MLSEAKLRDNLLRFFRKPKGVRTIENAERRWASAYTSYASDAEDLSGDPLLSGNTVSFRSALNFRAIRYTTQMAQQLETGFQSYWAGANFAVGNLVSGTGTPCPNVPVPPAPSSTLLFASEVSSIVLSVAPQALYSRVLPVLSRNFSGVTGEDQARRIASAMHEATISAVTVLITGVDTAIPAVGGPFVLTNTCTIS